MGELGKTCALLVGLGLAASSGLAWAANTSFKVYGGMGDGSAIPHVQRTSAASAIPHSLRQQVVDFPSAYQPGTIVIKTSERALYHVLPNGKATRYPVGVGREGFSWTGENTITRKAEWPDWRPPKPMQEREAKRGIVLPAIMKGGPGNPLGARALYIGDTEYRIHGTTQPWSIGRAVSSGCIRLLNAHVIELYQQVEIGTRVIVER